MEFVDKYRPRRLKDLLGQPAAVSRVQGMINNQRIPRQILISGPSGVGKTSLGYILAYLFNGVKYGRPLADLQEFNIGTDRGIDRIREIIAAANYAPRRKYRIMLLDEIHQATGAAASALLKPIEDAPERTIWLLVTSEPQALLPAIVRRCYLLPLVQPQPADILPLLRRVAGRERLQLPRKNKLLRDIATAANGQPALALQLLQGAADSGGADYAAMLAGAFAAVPDLAPSNLAIKILVFIYRRRPQLVLANLTPTPAAIPLLNALLTMNGWLLQNKIDRAPWRSPLTDKLAQHTEQISLARVLRVQNSLLDVRAEVQRFILPEQHLLPARLAYIAQNRGKTANVV